LQEKFEDTEDVTRRRKSNKDWQYNEIINKTLLRKLKSVQHQLNYNPG